jgi:hypothetical protein
MLDDGNDGGGGQCNSDCLKKLRKNTKNKGDHSNTPVIPPYVSSNPLTENPYSDWFSGQYSGCFLCHTAVANGQTVLTNPQLTASYNNATTAQGYGGLVIIGSLAAGAVIGSSLPAAAASTTTAGTTCVSNNKCGETIVSVIGRYPANEKLANSVGANYMNISVNVWNSMSRAEQWERNKEWLQEAIIRGDVFRLASKVSEAVPGTFFYQELEYLFTKAGYTISTNGQYLLPPP